MPKMVCAADDLTGALEVGALWATSGQPAKVVADARFPESCGELGPALVFDSETRHAAAAGARQTIQEIASKARDRGTDVFFKKTDSTLRGNIGAELSGLMSVWPGVPLVYIPAYPRMGRTCRNGQVMVNGIAVSETSFAQDPRDAVKESNVVRLLKSDTDRQIVSAKNRAELDAALSRSGEAPLIVCDAEVENDIAALTETLFKESGPKLVAGPAGIAPYLARKAAPEKASIPRLAATTRTLTVSGTLHPMSIEQLRVAVEQGAWTSVLPCRGMEIEDDQLREADQRVAQQLTERFAVDRHLVIRTSDAELPLREFLPLTLRPELRLAQIAMDVWKHSDIQTLIIFGGDTAFSIWKAAGLPELEPVGELLPGVPLTHVRSGLRSGYWVTKAGGFGDKTMWCRILKLLGISQCDSALFNTVEQ